MRVIDSSTWLPANNIGNLLSNAQLDIPKMQAGGLDVAFSDLIHRIYSARPLQQQAVGLINTLHWTERMNKDKFGLATTVKEIEALVREGNPLAFHDRRTYSLEEYNAIELLRQYYDLESGPLPCVGAINSLGEGVNERYVGTPSQGGLTELERK